MRKLLCFLITIALTMNIAIANDDAYEFQYIGDNDMEGDGQLGNSADYTVPAHIFTIVDKEGKEEQVYCADFNTMQISKDWTDMMGEEPFSYKEVNIEDSDYYSKEQAEQIRSILNNGYWRTEENGSIDNIEEGQENGNKQNPTLDALRQAIGDENLTEREALTGTQWAIWEHTNEHDAPQEVYHTDEDSIERIEAVHDYLNNLEGTTASDTNESVIFTDKEFISIIEEIFHTEDVEIRYDILGTLSDEDQLIFSVTVNENSPIFFDDSWKLGSVKIPITKSGEYNLTFNLTGIQKIAPGYYLYQSETRYEDLLDSEISSQTFVGWGEGFIDVEASHMFSLVKNEEDPPPSPPQENEEEAPPQEEDDEEITPPEESEEDPPLTPPQNNDNEMPDPPIEDETPPEEPPSKIEESHTPERPYYVPEGVPEEYWELFDPSIPLSDFDLSDVPQEILDLLEDMRVPLATVLPQTGVMENYLYSLALGAAGLFLVIKGRKMQEI